MPAAMLLAMVMMSGSTPVAELANCLEKAGRCRIKTAFAEYRFEHDSGGIARIGVSLEHHFKTMDGIFFADALIGHGVGGTKHIARHTAEVRGVRCDLAVHGHGHEGTAMVTTGEADDVVFTSSGASNLDCIFQRLGTRVGQHDLGVATYRRHLTQALCNLHVALIGDHGLAGVHQTIELGLDRRNDLRVAVTDIEDSDPAGKIDDALAVGIPDQGIFGVINKLGGGAGGAIGDIALFELVELGIIHWGLLGRAYGSDKPLLSTYCSSANSSKPQPSGFSMPDHRRERRFPLH